MKAVWIDRYGPPEVLAVREVAVPQVGPRDVLVRQAATNVSRAADCAFRSADPFIVRFFTGLLRPKAERAGRDDRGDRRGGGRTGDAVQGGRPGIRDHGTVDGRAGRADRGAGDGARSSRCPRR